MSNSVMDIVTGGCSFPLCRYNRDKGSEFCLHHRKHFGSAEVKKKKPIATRSPKRIKEQRVYVKVVKEMIGENDQCEIKGPTCTGKAQGLDHLQKRSPGNLLKKSNLKRACNACNLYKELNPGWAEKSGNSISRFKKILKNEL